MIFVVFLVALKHIRRWSLEFIKHVIIIEAEGHSFSLNAPRIQLPNRLFQQSWGVDVVGNLSKVTAELWAGAFDTFCLYLILLESHSNMERGVRGRDMSRCTRKVLSCLYVPTYYLVCSDHSLSKAQWILAHLYISHQHISPTYRSW